MALKNYNEQLNNLKRCDDRINELVDFSKKLNALSVTMQSVWECNTDRERIFESFNSLISSIDIIIDWFYKFRSRATIYLNKLNTLEWIVHGQYLPCKKEQASSLISEGYGSRKTRIQISVAEFDGFYTQLKKMADDLETVKKRTSNINNNIDVMIKKQFVNGEKTLTDIIKRLDMVKEHTIQAADAVKGVGEIYKQRETALKNFATQYMLKGQSSGEVKLSIENNYNKYKNNVASGNWPTENKYFMYDLNDANLYPKQTPSKCTLYANLYLMTRYSIMHGGSAITPETYINYTNKELWSSGGMTDDYTFTVAGETVHVQNCQEKNKYMSEKSVINMNAAEKVEYVKDLLAVHPEGIVVYDHDTARAGTGTHAILVTGYDDASGQFLVIDPAGGTPSGIIKEREAIVSVENIEAVWVIDSY